MKKDIGWLYGKAIKVGDERMKMTKENEVKRYKIHSHSWQMIGVDGEYQETEYEGPWVKYSDYQALQKRLEEVEQDRTKWMRVCDDQIKRLEEIEEGNKKLREQNYCSQCGELFENVGKYKDKLNKAIEVIKKSTKVLSLISTGLARDICLENEDFIKDVEK